MLYYLTVVIGFTILIGIVILGNMFFIGKNMNSHDAEKVDPKPSTDFTSSANNH